VNDVGAIIGKMKQTLTCSGVSDCGFAGKYRGCCVADPDPEVRFATPAFVD
jgi:hypothetical protein